MSDDRRHGLFPWSRDGVGLRVNTKTHAEMSHEVLFEDEFTHLKENPLFLGVVVPRSRFIFAMVVALAAVLVLCGRAFSMQILQGASYRMRAEENRLRVDVVPARRGIIRDREGRILAENVPSFDLRVVPWLLPQAADERDVLLARVGREVGMSLDDIHAALASSTDPTQSLTLMRDVPYDRAVAARIQLGDDPAMHIVTGSKRRYPESTAIDSLSHVIGYVGAISPQELASHPAYHQIDLIGKTGIESSYESVLRGIPGEQRTEVDAQNRVTSVVSQISPQDGKDVVLSIDLDLQEVAEKALKEEFAAAKLSRGSVVVMDPRDGSVLAAVSLPAYDDNMFSGTVSSTAYASLIQNEDHPLLPRAWAGVYPSGSTVKPAIATAALSEGVITPNTTVNSVGGIKIGSTFFPDWKAGGHGLTSVRKAIALSVNSFFYYIGGGYESFIGLGVDRLTAWMRKFGLGSVTGIDVPGEAAGFVPSKEWKERTKGERWYVGDTYNLSIGQGDLLVTPLQVALWTAEVANGAFPVVPHMAEHLGSGDGMLTVTSTRSTQAIADPSVIRVVQEGMRDTVVYGSGRALSSLPFPVSGKTGTAQWRNDKANHAWFTSFAPSNDPQIVVTVLLEEGGEGSTTAIPVARKVLEAWYAKQAAGHAGP